MQAERLGGVAPVRPGASERAPDEQHRPRAVGRVRLRPGSYAAGDDALWNRRYPVDAGRGSSVLESILTRMLMKQEIALGSTGFSLWLEFLHLVQRQAWGRRPVFVVCLSSMASRGHRPSPVTQSGPHRITLTPSTRVAPNAAGTS